MPEDPLSTTFAALADPTRRALLARLAEGEATVGELAAPFAMTLQAISKHLKVLERAGLVVRGKDAQWRPCRLESAPLERASEWIEANRKTLDAFLSYAFEQGVCSRLLAAETLFPPEVLTTFRI